MKVWLLQVFVLLLFVELGAIIAGHQDTGVYSA